LLRKHFTTIVRTVKDNATFNTLLTVWDMLLHNKQHQWMFIFSD